MRPKRMNRSANKKIPHGTAGGYTNHNCNCPKCTRAFRSAMAVSKVRRVKRGLEPDDPRHGKASTYTNWHCRCEACRAAHHDERTKAI